MSIQVYFGVGNAIFTRTDITYSTPTKYNVLQDVEIDFDFTNKMLVGQYQFPVDVARGEGKITGKAKVGSMFARGINDTFFGQTLAAGTAGTLYVNNEADSVPGSSTYTITVAQASSFVADQGVVNAATGIPLVATSSGSPTTGQYNCNSATGVYTFNSAQAGLAVLISYTYSVTTGASQISIANQLMGTSPVFSMVLNTLYKGNNFTLKLNAAIATKLTFPFKNVDYAINDIEFQAYADASGNIGSITLTQ